MNGQPIRTEINNGVLSTIKSMPMKDITSDNQASFELNRKLFFKAFQPKVNFAVKQTSRSVVQRESPGIHPVAIIDGPKTTLQKKWIGGNRDASSVAIRKRTNTTGIVETRTGSNSFKNIRDTTTRNNALARVRGAGARVPPKVANNISAYLKNTRIFYPVFRIISTGAAATGDINTGVVTAPGSAYGISAGFYKYLSPIDPGSVVANRSSGTFNTSYNVLVINRSTGAFETTTYNVFADVANAYVLVDYLNALSSDVIVIIATYNNPQHTTINGTPWQVMPSTFFEAIFRCGGSPALYPYWFGGGKLYFQGAYVLVGIPGIGTGNGLEKVTGIQGSVSWIDLQVSIVNGQYSLVSFAGGP